MRHSKEGAPLVASIHSGIPVINAGDGGHQHPTQTFTDLMTIRTLKGRLDNLTIGLCGDLKFGRTVHSLINSLARYSNIKFVLISPKELRVPDYIRDDVLNANNIEYEEVENLESAMPELDILYMTRIQRERFFNEEEYMRMKGFYILDNEKMKSAKPDMLVLHPLPRVNEISVEVDNDSRAAYFKQAQFGVYVRMALIMKLLEVENHVKCRKIENGIVIDHIPAGKSMDIYRYLGLGELDSCVAIIKNAKSDAMGRKDIIKVDGGEDLIDINLLGFIDTNITVNIIRNGEIAEKNN